MIIHDPLYGRFTLPPRLSTLITTPEVRRLSQIRLLNTLTPSLATLGELRRYAHTLGVQYLCQQNVSALSSVEESDALAASILIHDIGTPPFGHLLEYHLREACDFDHEKIINSILWGNYAPENTAHQIFGKRAGGFRKALKQSGISVELVEAIITRRHRLSQLIFGTMDLDNLDNVARMAFSLGMGLDCGQLAVRLAGALGVTEDRRLVLDRTRHESDVLKWAAHRRQVYRVIVFDPPTVAAQAVLSQAIATAIRDNVISENEWFYSDEALIEALLAHSGTKETIAVEYLGTLPRLAFCVRVAGAPSDFNMDRLAEAKELIERVLHEVFPGRRVLGYAFLDKGTFEKRLTFCDPRTGRDWELGQTSGSVIFYGFIRSKTPLPFARCTRSAGMLLRCLPTTEEATLFCQAGERILLDEGQPSHNLAAIER